MGASMAVGLGFAVPVPASPVRPTCADAATVHRVAVVVQHGSGSPITRCVAFTTSQISGDQLLAISGIEYRTVDFGGTLGRAVCQIDSEPASFPPRCFADGAPFWALSVSHTGGPWMTSAQGIGSQMFSDGDAAGFRYDPATGPPPDPPSPAGVCAAAARVQAPAAGARPANGPSPLSVVLAGLAGGALLLLLGAQLARRRTR